MQQYDADFANADPANIPLDGQLFVSLPPILWFAIIVIVLAAMTLGWWMGRGGQSADGDAAGRIWDDLNDAAKDAMKADGDSLPGQAAALHRMIQSRLGKTLKLAGGLSKQAKALEKALKGEPAETAHASDHDKPKPHGKDNHPDSGHGEDVPAAAGVTIVNSGTVIVNGETPKPDHPGGQDHDGPKPLSVKQRNDALRLAVGDFNDYWRHRGDRIREMRDACTELSGAGLPRRSAPKLSGGH